MLSVSLLLMLSLFRSLSRALTLTLSLACALSVSARGETGPGKQEACRPKGEWAWERAIGRARVKARESKSKSERENKITNPNDASNRSYVSLTSILGHVRHFHHFRDHACTIRVPERRPHILWTLSITSNTSFSFRPSMLYYIWCAYMVRTCCILREFYSLHTYIHDNFFYYHVFCLPFRWGVVYMIICSIYTHDNMLNPSHMIIVRGYMW